MNRGGFDAASHLVLFPGLNGTGKLFEPPRNMWLMKVGAHSTCHRRVQRARFDVS
jgi:hypothetical protein